MKIPKVIGKGCKPFYNSFVTTMAYMQAKGDYSYKQKINNMSEQLQLIWIDDLCQEMSKIIFDQEYRHVLQHWVDRGGHFIPCFSYFNMSMGEIVSNIEGVHRSGRHGDNFKELVEYYKTYELPKT